MAQGHSTRSGCQDTVPGHVMVKDTVPGQGARTQCQVRVPGHSCRSMGWCGRGGVLTCPGVGPPPPPAEWWWCRSRGRGKEAAAAAAMLGKW
ncbi:hypothetical protein Pcinc_033509 [Petrolisthes cinctipes]|uniref:Uncharacterized protein n=1 Tax=Petrolisthes cinctipes TaxID=88211 RepID=A0AAE1K1Q6_PETCI|nr:hypothetical protein Pcinc_033509 [Petrolisthes cinctipes]